MGETPFKSASDLLEIPTAKQPTRGQGLTLDETGQIPSSLAVSAPTGSVTMYAASTAPSGWLSCDGSSQTTTAYPTLFGIIGYTYGGAGANFNLPDLRGRAPVGYAASGGHADVNAVGNSDGTAAASRRPKHSHSYSLSGSINDPAEHNGTGTTGPNAANSASLQSAGVTISGTIGVSGTTDAPSYITLNFIIKT